MSALNEALARQRGSWRKLENLARELRLESRLLLAMTAVLIVAALTLRFVSFFPLALLVMLASGAALWLAAGLYEQWSPPYTTTAFLVLLLGLVTPALWMFSVRKILQGNPAIRKVHARHFDEAEQLPELAVVRDRIKLDYTFNLKLPPNEPVLQHFSSGQHEVVLVRPGDYTLLRRKTTVAQASTTD